MTTVHSVTSDDLRVIVCLAFDHRAAPDEIARCKAAVVNCPSVLHSVELSGTFDFMFEATVPDMEAYQLQLRSCAGALAKFASRYEANFVCNRFVRGRRATQEIWVPSEDGILRIDCSAVDKVNAEGDYMRIQSRGRSWMLHTTMAEMVESLGEEDFVKLNRSIIVRVSFIERLQHEGRVWTARLADGSRERIAKSHIVAVLARLRTNSSKAARASSKSEPIVELAEITQRKATALVAAG
jgi:DNA-binding LytR/AlgR family response regulator